MAPMKVKCVKCSTSFDLSKNEHDDGDSVECPECYAAHIVLVEKGRFVLVPEESKYEIDEGSYYNAEDYDE